MNSMITPRPSFLMIMSLSLAMFQLSSVTLASSFMPSSGLTSRKRSQQLIPNKQSFLIQLTGGSDEEAANINQEDTSTSSVDVEPKDAIPAETAPQQNSLLLGPNATPPGWMRRRLPGLPYHKLPDYLTYLRCLAIPVFCGLFYLPGQHVATGVLFALASLTDWLDGFLARRWDISSAFGAWLDPVSDKIMASTALILLTGRYGAVLAIPTCIILAREIAVSALREWMAHRGERETVKVGYQGKLKTALTLISLTLLLLVPETGEDTPLIHFLLPGLASLYASALLTVTSGSVYFRAAASALLGK